MNNGPHWRAAELHDLPAHAHSTAAAHQENTGLEHSKQAMEHSITGYRHSQEAHQESESSVNETGKNGHAASGPPERTNARPKARALRPGKRASQTPNMAAKKNSDKDRGKFKKVMSKKAAVKKKVAKERSSPKKAERAKQARIEMEFIGPTEELGKLLFDLFQTHELKTGHAKEIARDAKIELLPGRVEKGTPSVVILLSIGLGVPESLASKYLWGKCEKFSKSREVKVLINRTEYVYNEHELKEIIKTSIETETEEK
jgi:hypothetical protein